MIIAEYIGNLWVQQPLDSINTAFNYLVSVDRNRYVEVKEFFFKFLLRGSELKLKRQSLLGKIVKEMNTLYISLLKALVL